MKRLFQPYLTSDLKQLNTKRPRHGLIEIHILVWDGYRNVAGLNLLIGCKPSQPTISLEMPVPSQGHDGFHSFPIVD